HLLRAAAPPYYSLLRALDSATGVRAYAPSPKGQDRVWVEIGCEHPLARFLRPDPEGMLLVSQDGFTVVTDGKFEDMYTLVDLGGAGDAKVIEHPPVDEPPRIDVTLRLARANTTDAPTLWVIREDAVTKIERLLSSLPEEVSRGLLFSACKNDEETIVVV